LYKIYCDFDATVTNNDLWHLLFSKFGKPEAFTIWKEFGRGKMTAAECIQFACSTVHGVDRAEAEAMFRNEAIRPGFREFADYLAEKEIMLRIVSDGFTSYIRPVLEANSLDIPFQANLIEITDEGKLSIDFRDGRESCRACAACKCAYIISTSSNDDTIVYVGDGYSDVCPIEIADIVFARDTLLRSCGEKGIPHHPFNDFFQVREIIKNYLKDRPKYKREQARRARNQLVIAE
jgi:2-hydroxy-3-keto-5-methylthiopentenyl-1-phosphate phosphatase